MLFDRFFAVIDGDQDGVINRIEFVSNISKIYMGDLNTKLLFTFQIFDLDKDGHITPDDIRFIMSHIPFVRSLEHETPDSLNIRQKHFFKEGQYSRSDGKITLYKDRISD